MYCPLSVKFVSGCLRSISAAFPHSVSQIDIVVKTFESVFVKLYAKRREGGKYPEFRCK